MKKQLNRFFPLCVLLFWLPMSAFGATLSLDDDLELLYLNKQTPAFLDSKTKVEMAAGPQQLILRYRKLFEQRGERDEYRSEPMIISFSVKESDALQMSVPDMRRASEAKQFARAPQLTLQSSDHSEYPFSQAILPAFTGFTFNRDILAEVAKWEELQKEAAAKSTPTESTESGSALTELKQWYNRATPDEKEQFLLWLYQQKK